MFSPRQRIEFTREWTGERFADGRPKVPDPVLERLETVTIGRLWNLLSEAGYRHQFEGDWMHVSTDRYRLIGRAVTAVFMPVRPDVNAVIDEHGRVEKRVGPGQNSWIIDMLQPGDVMVVDLFSRVNLIGDNLATSIYAKSGRGVVIDGGVRDLSGIRRIEGFSAYIRQANPDVIRDVMLMGINVPIRIGGVTVMPGDVVLGGPEGVLFIPPHLAEQFAQK